MKRLSTVFALTALATAAVASAQTPPANPCWTIGSSHAAPSTCPIIPKTRPPNTLYVCLVKDATNQTVVGIDDDNGKACVVDNKQTITWKIVDSDPNEVFLGFTWVDTRPPNPPVGNFEISPDGKQATMSNSHKHGEPTSSWPYQLFVGLNGKTYYVGKKPIRTNTNPNIKNN